MTEHRPALQDAALHLVALIPIAPLLYFFGLQATSIDHKQAYFAAWTTLVWLVPLALLLPQTEWRQFRLTPIDLLYAVATLLIVVHLAFITLEPNFRHWVLLGTFWMGPYVVARLLPALGLRIFLKNLGIVSLIISLGAIAFQLASDLHFGFSVRSILLDVNHGSHLVALAFGIFIVLASSGAVPTTIGATCFVVGLTTAQLVLLGSRGVLLATIASSAAMALAPVRNQRVQRILVLAAILIGATSALSLNVAARDFLIRVYSPMEQPADANVPSLSTRIYGLSAEECAGLKKLVDSTPIRLWLLHQSTLLSQQHPATGIGFDNFSAYTCPGAFPHSTILQSFVELGAVGGLVHLSLLAIAALSLLMIMLERRSSIELNLIGLTVFGLLTFFFALDQFYGRLLLSSTMPMTLGLASSLAASSSKRLIQGWLPFQTKLSTGAEHSLS